MCRSSTHFCLSSLQGFFRRTVLSSVRLECLSNNDCPITPANRNMCKSCRFQRCLAVGMSKSGSRIGRQPNAIKYYCAREISQLSSTGEADGAPSSSSITITNGRGASTDRPRTSSISSSEGDKVRPPTPLSRTTAPWASADRTVQPAQSSTDRGSSSVAANNALTSNGQSFTSLSSANKNSGGNNGRATQRHNVRSFSSDSPLEIQGKPAAIFAAAGTKKRKSIGNSQQQQHSVNSTKLDVPSPGSLELECDRLKYSPTQAIAFSEAHSSSNLSPGTLVQDLTQPRGSRNWYATFSQNSGDAVSYDRGRLGGIPLDALSQTPIMEYSLPNPDMSSHISSTTTSLHEIRSPIVEFDDEPDVPQETNGKMLNPLAVRLPSDEASEDLVTSYCKSFGSDPAALDVLPRREPSSTFVYSPSLDKDSTGGLYPYANRPVVQSSPSRHILVSSDTGSVPQSTVRLLPSDDEVPQAQGVDPTSSRSTRSIVDHLTSTVLQFRQQHQQRMSSVASDTPVGAIKLSVPSPVEAASNALRVTAHHSQRLSELPCVRSDEADGVYPIPSSSPPVQPTPPTRTVQSSAYHAYPLPSSCKSASPEFAWHSQSSQQQHQMHTHTHPKQRYVKSNGSPSVLDSTQFRAPSGGGGGHTSKYCDSSPHSVNGNSHNSPPAVTAALCAAAAADVTSSTSTSAPWFAAAAAAAAMANVLMVASQAPSSSSNTGSLADAYAIYSSGNGCQAERLKVSGSEGPLTVNSSGPPICSVTQHRLEQYMSGLVKCDASTVLRSLQLPTSGVDAQASSRLTHPSTVAAMRAAAAAAAAAAATAAGLVLSNSGVRPLPDELAQMQRTTAAAAAALTTFSDVPMSYENSAACCSSPSPPSSQPQPPQHIFGRVSCTIPAETPMIYGSMESKPTVNLSASRKDCELIGRTKNGIGALFVTVQDFAVGIQLAAKYMISERKKIRNNLPPVYQSMQSLDRVEDVWDRMMLHFELHSRFIVHFVKLIPGFNQLELSDKRQLVRKAMYPLMLLELSRDYVNGDSTQYNYFDFTEDEREVIFKHFPTFHTIIGHLIRSGEFLHRIRLDNIELVLVCAQEVFKSQPGLIDSASADHLFSLASRALTNHIIDSGQPLEERSSMLRLLSPLLEELNIEHHQVIAQLRQDKPQLDFPELYTEMFQLSEAEEGEQLEHAALMQSAESRS
ncbi:Nuclear receptor 2DBD gamma [Fasciola gigantica]|uniref:Nuclear receptor 2DBD gamma n=1 Tax=Fasciola gigantica TaxID=46835 RepID=A0A504YA43_FASGI|nr:Nuclear receptor 2DBD gamma [Fasciola gigantica]